MKDLTTRFADVMLEADEAWDGIADPYENMAEHLIATLNLHYEYENGLVFYKEKPAACKANGNWTVYIRSDKETYTDE